MPVLPVQDISLHYQHLLPQQASNHGIPLLLLSGMASDSASWQPVIARLQQRYELIVPDNRCTGRTTPCPVVTNRELMIDDTLGLLDSLQIEKVNILGHSMGGMLGWAIASRAPSRVNHLFSAAALPQVLPARIALFNSLSSLRLDESETEWFKLLYQFLFCPEFFDDPVAVSAAALASQSYPHKQDAESFATQAKGLESFLEAPEISNITCPITLVTGSHDSLTTPVMIEKFAANHAGVRTHVIQNAAHALHWEQTDAFVDCVLEALED